MNKLRAAGLGTECEKTTPDVARWNGKFWQWHEWSFILTDGWCRTQTQVSSSPTNANFYCQVSTNWNQLSGSFKNNISFLNSTFTKALSASQTLDPIKICLWATQLCAIHVCARVCVSINACSLRSPIRYSIRVIFFCMPWCDIWSRKYLAIKDARFSHMAHIKIVTTASVTLRTLTEGHGRDGSFYRTVHFFLTTRRVAL